MTFPAPWVAGKPARFTVWGCPLMTQLTADHPYFHGFVLRSPLLLMMVGDTTTGACGDRLYTVERVS